MTLFYELTQDIDCTNYNPINQLSKFKKNLKSKYFFIDDVNSPFTGQLNGNNFKIKNIVLTQTSDNYGKSQLNLFNN